ncbi:MAG: hypothetical protein H6901_07405 [Rhodobacteraceae bacterium]|nr:hypothetical protein [Paracoccaceae bacterium]MCP5342024.1 hypothetical protein [Paracoccaceae bacterium]
MFTINPGLFTRLMKLPDAARTDLLEFIGATPVADAQLSEIIDNFSIKKSPERGKLTLKTG